MKKILLETSFSKIYMIVMIIITLLILGGYFSYAMFTVTKEKENAISIVTGNLTYGLLIDGEEGNTLNIPAKTTREFTITLSNPNNRKARFNFYYLYNLPNGINVGYIIAEGINIPPKETGINLEQSGSSGSSNTYKINVTNTSSSGLTITLGVEVGLDYNDLNLPSDGHLFEEYKMPVSDVVLTNLGDDGNTYNDGEDTFITGNEPNNYIWYSGKLWRAVLVNNKAKTTKLVTEWNISAVPYNNGNSSFADSHIEKWLNDTSIDGFLGNLRDYENFIVKEAIWDTTMDNSALGSIIRPNGTTTVTAAVGLLNMYEYQTTFKESTYNNSYLNNSLFWWTITPYDASQVLYISQNGAAIPYSVTHAYGIRPTINLKRNVKVVNGDGSKNNPYRLEEDNDINLNGTKLNTRYSGEYISFGNDENNLYRIVSHETEGLTKITSAKPLKDSGAYKTTSFGDTTTFSSSNTIGSFLNNDYLNPSTGFLTEEQVNMIDENTTWYLGTVSSGQNYKLAKYTDETSSTITSNTTTSKVGLLRLGELMAGQFDIISNNADYWPLTAYSNTSLRSIYSNGNVNYNNTNIEYGIKPAFNLKQNVIITGGDGTLQNPFQIALE